MAESNDPKAGAKAGDGNTPPQQQQAPQQQAQPQAQQAKAADAPASARPAAANARTSGKSRDLARPDRPLGPISATRAEAIRLGREAGERSRAPRLPTAQELDRIRDEYFGGDPGTVRVDAPPEGSGPDAPPTRLIFFDADGRRAGERDYTGPDDQE
jgi:hypothetical protein